MFRTKKRSLEWKDIFTIMHRDRSGRWWPYTNLPAATYIEEGFYRTPSCKWPRSYARALMTQKFAKWLVENHPSEALALGLLSNTESETSEVRDFTIMITPLENQLMDNHG